MTRKAWDILEAGAPDAYARALAALREDTRTYWHECMTDPPKDGLAYTPNADKLKAWIDCRWKEWYEDPIAELENRTAIRDQALGIAYAAQDLDVPARYEVHLDRKLAVAMVGRGFGRWSNRHHPNQFGNARASRIYRFGSHPFGDWRLKPLAGYKILYPTYSR